MYQAISICAEISQDDIIYYVSETNKECLVGDCNPTEHLVIADTIMYNDTIYSVERIADYAFSSNKKLQSIAIPSSINNIGAGAFGGCTGLNTIISLNPTPPTCDETAFADVDMSTCTLYVPKDAFVAYWSAEVWKDFKNIKMLTQAESLSLDSTKTVLLNDTMQLVATLTPENVSINKLSWESSDTIVVRVDGNGTLVGLAVGKSIITAKTIDGSNLTATCEVEVPYIKIDAISINQDSVKLKKRESVNLICTISPEGTNYTDVT